MFDLKADPKLPHHYIIGVAKKPVDVLENSGEVYLKYGPVYFTHEDIKNIQSVLILSKDRIYTDIYKLEKRKLVEMYSCGEVLHLLYGLQLAARVNQASLHHFSSEFEIPEYENFFEGFVKRANKKDSEEMKKLHESRIGKESYKQFQR